MLYLTQYSGGDWDLDRELSAAERADSTAFAAFLEADGQQLIDLSLYVSSDNYAALTAPALAAFLDWPNQWIIPPRLRAAARERTDHLGLSSLDVDAAASLDADRAQNRDSSALIPASLRRAKPASVSGLLLQSARQARIRLAALAGRLLQPLAELLGDKTHLLTDRSPTSLDCIALAYLSLALIPGLPSPWLADAVQTQTPSLVIYAERLHSRCFGVLANLPWQTSPPAGAIAATVMIGCQLLDALADAMPVVRDLRAAARLGTRRDGDDGDDDGDNESRELIAQVAAARRREALASAATVTGGVAIFVAYLARTGLVGGGSAASGLTPPSLRS